MAIMIAVINVLQLIDGLENRSFKSYFGMTVDFNWIVILSMILMPTWSINYNIDHKRMVFCATLRMITGALLAIVAVLFFRATA